VSVGPEQAVDGGGAHGGDLILGLRFQDLRQLREEGLQPLGTDPVAGFLPGLQGRNVWAGLLYHWWWVAVEPARPGSRLCDAARCSAPHSPESGSFPCGRRECVGSEWHTNTFHPVSRHDTLR
jgi:hypothetical protein